jgi:hypothetical protein
MIASTTQDTLIDAKKESSPTRALIHSISTLEPDEFHSFIQEQYGACWGTLKFEDSLSDYSNEVNFCYFIFY